MIKEIIHQEIQFKTALSGGKGGQHVNKVSTKAILIFSFEVSEGLSDTEKEEVRGKLKNSINKEGQIIIHCDTSRSQLKNKQLAEKRLFEKLKLAFFKPKKRIQKTPSRAQIEKRLQQKKSNAEKKARRRDDKGLY